MPFLMWPVKNVVIGWSFSKMRSPEIVLNVKTRFTMTEKITGAGSGAHLRRPI